MAGCSHARLGLPGVPVEQGLVKRCPASPSNSPSTGKASSTERRYDEPLDQLAGWDTIRIPAVSTATGQQPF